MEEENIPRYTEDCVEQYKNLCSQAAVLWDYS